MENTTSKTRNSASVIWGLALIVVGILAIFNRSFRNLDELISTIILGGIALTFGAVYAANRSRNRWALIPAYVFAAIATLVFLTSFMHGDFIAVFVLLAIAAPFVYVYLRDPMKRWALIPAYVMVAISGLIALEWLFTPGMEAAYVMFAIAAPFVYVYSRDRSKRWALIPAGVMGFIGLVSLVSGMSWLLPVALIGVGVYVLLKERGKHTAAYAPATGPAADKPLAGFEPLGQKAGDADREKAAK